MIMLATGATSAAAIRPIRAQSSSCRANNSRLIAEISAKAPSIRPVCSTRRRTTATSSVGTYRSRLAPPIRPTDRYTYGPCNSPSWHRHPSLPQRRPWLTTEPRSVVSRFPRARASRRRRARSCGTLSRSKLKVVLCLTDIQDHPSAPDLSSFLFRFRMVAASSARTSAVSGRDAGGSPRSVNSSGSVTVPSAPPSQI
jgi:hypothetical protein